MTTPSASPKQNLTDYLNAYYPGSDSMHQVKQWQALQKQWNVYFWFNECKMNSWVYKAHLVFHQMFNETPRIFFSGTNTRGQALLEWKTAWFFTEDTIMKVDYQNGNENYEFIPIKNRITRITLNNRPNTVGALAIQFTLDDGEQHTLEAWGNYCEVLKDVVLNYLRPNMNVPPSDRERPGDQPDLIPRPRTTVRQKPFRLTT